MIFIIFIIVILAVVVFMRFNKAPTQKLIKPHKTISRSGMKNSKYSGEMFNFSPNKSEASDYLGKAAKVGNEAKQAVKYKDFNKAWKLFHEQKSYYMKHANKSGFSAQDALSLDSNVHEHLANILRIEGKHHDAFFNILYWVIASKHRPIKKHEQKLLAYFNRCKFKNISLTEVNNYIEEQGDSLVDVLNIKEQVGQWRTADQLP